MKVRDMVQSILGLQSDLQKIRKSNPKAAKRADDIYRELGL